MRRASGSTSRSGIPYVPDAAPGPEDVVAEIRARRPGGKLLNLDRMLLNSPSYAKGWNGLLRAIRGELSLPARLRELVIVAIASLNGAAYEWAHHAKELLAAGGTRAELSRLRKVPAAAKDAKRFGEVERAALTLTVEMTRDVKVKAATLRRVRKLLPEAQVVELIGTIAAYNMVSRFIVATGIELEEATRP